MKFITSKSKISGAVSIPGSKSHTIRALAFGLLAKGESVIERPLVSSDTESCIAMIEALGAKVAREQDLWRITGTGGNLSVPEDVINVGNSGTTLFFGIGLAALVNGSVVFTGDSSIRKRSAQSLLLAINHLGGQAFSTRKNGRPPVVVTGPVPGGGSVIESVTSQYLSSLLIALPCAAHDSVIDVTKLNEHPYVDMTLTWMGKLGVKCENRDYRQFIVAGGQRYSSFREVVPGDFSSATFFFEAAAITGCELSILGLDNGDSQGDSEVLKILQMMGASVSTEGGVTVVKGGGLKGGTFDLNAIPDSLPALAVCACFAEGETRLVNVAQARIKETDRIAVMCRELSRLGADIRELPDGLAIKGTGGLKGGKVGGHGDHRVVMALAVAGLASDAPIEVDTAESSRVTFPSFFDLMQSIGADIRREEK